MRSILSNNNLPNAKQNNLIALFFEFKKRFINNNLFIILSIILMLIFVIMASIGYRALWKDNVYFFYQITEYKKLLNGIDDGFGPLFNRYTELIFVLPTWLLLKLGIEAANILFFVSSFTYAFFIFASLIFNWILLTNENKHLIIFPVLSITTINSIISMYLAFGAYIHLNLYWPIFFIITGVTKVANEDAKLLIIFMLGLICFYAYHGVVFLFGFLSLYTFIIALPEISKWITISNQKFPSSAKIFICISSLFAFNIVALNSFKRESELEKASLKYFLESFSYNMPTSDLIILSYLIISLVLLFYITRIKLKYRMVVLLLLAMFLGSIWAPIFLKIYDGFLLYDRPFRIIAPAATVLLFLVYEKYRKLDYLLHTSKISCLSLNYSLSFCAILFFTILQGKLSFETYKMHSDIKNDIAINNGLSLINSNDDKIHPIWKYDRDNDYMMPFLYILYQRPYVTRLLILNEPTVLYAKDGLRFSYGSAFLPFTGPNLTKFDLFNNNNILLNKTINEIKIDKLSNYELIKIAKKNLKLPNSPKIILKDNFNNALLFRGESYLDIGSITSSDTEGFSISCWIYLNEALKIDEHQVIFDTGHTASQNVVLQLTGIKNYTNNIELAWVAGGSSIVKYIKVKQWYFIVVSAEPLSKQISLHVDGEKIFQTTAPNILLKPNSKLTIGALTDTHIRNYQGLLAEFNFYNKNLSNTDIKLLYKNQKMGFH